MKYNARNSLQNCIHCRRYTVAGVFSKCLISKWTDNCCMDPVVYEKINGEIKHWIWKTAKGVRESKGCPKKESKSMKLCNSHFFTLHCMTFFVFIYRHSSWWLLHEKICVEEGCSE